jgi:tRNA(Ile)-lysidine synthase
VPAADERKPVSDAEAASLFADLADCKALVLAVSGGPDSTVLLLLASRWRRMLREGPLLAAVTVDHGLRPEARREAAAVGRLAASLGVAHRTLRWTGPKPNTGLQEAARTARYRLLASAAMRAKASRILTAHTLDDQAETVLFRLARGSGLTGLAAMARTSPLPVGDSLPLPARGNEGLILVRPFLDIPKARLIATLEAAQIPFVDDPSNRDPRFARVRLRALMPALAAEGLTAPRLAQLAKRMKRADEAIEAVVDRLAAALAAPSLAARDGGGLTLTLSATEWTKAPAEIRLRLLGRLIVMAGDEGDIELGKLEACEQAVTAHLYGRAPERFRRTLAGAAITLAGGRLTISRAPPRRKVRTMTKTDDATRPGAGLGRAHQAQAK